MPVPPPEMAVLRMFQSQRIFQERNSWNSMGPLIPSYNHNSCLGVVMKRTRSRPILGFLLLGAAVAVSPSTTLGQSCSFITVPQGRGCSKEGARCSPPTVGGGNVGKCTTEAGQANTLVCECQGAPTPSYNMTLSPLTPATLSAGVATSTITVIPFNGFTGKVDFACTISGMGHPAPPCATPAPATVTGPSSATSLLTVSASSSTGDAAFTVTVNALRSEEHTSELQSRPHLVCRLLLENKK